MLRKTGRMEFKILDGSVQLKKQNRHLDFHTILVVIVVVLLLVSLLLPLMTAFTF